MRIKHYDNLFSGTSLERITYYKLTEIHSISQDNKTKNIIIEYKKGNEILHSSYEASTMVNPDDAFNSIVSHWSRLLSLNK